MNIFEMHLGQESEGSSSDAVVAEHDQNCPLQVTPGLESFYGGGERVVDQCGHIEAIVGQTGGPHKSKVPLKGKATRKRLCVVEKKGDLRTRSKAKVAIVRVRVSDFVLGGYEQRPGIVVGGGFSKSSFLRHRVFNIKKSQLFI